MALVRRRHRSHHRFRQLLLPAISAFLLLILCFLCLLALSSDPEGTRNLHHLSATLNNDEDKADDDVNGITVLRVPSREGRVDRDIWTSKHSKLYYGCSNSSKSFSEAGAITKPDRYLMIETSGGLNQQRTGITDAVVTARILNATLVVPTLDHRSFWKDSSNFSDIFDVDWFISFLKRDVRVIKELPRNGGKAIGPHTMLVPRKCDERCYQTRVLPILVRRHAVRLTKFDYRLANRLDTNLQKLRCRVNYHALDFTNSIREMGQKLVQRMRARSKHFIAIHLRFEPDMLAFSGCYYGGGEKEKRELGAIRKRWSNIHLHSPEKTMRQGRCPLTPEEVGLMLRALGYDNDVHIYVASGDVYGGEDSLAPLKVLFPNFYTKETLARKEELDQFSSFSSRMAALDFIVCDESDVFVANNNGNMARILVGRRRYFGHKPTIRPNAKKLYRLFTNKRNISWNFFVSKVRKYQKGFMGDPLEVRAGRGEFHENPSSCICKGSDVKAMKHLVPRKFVRGNKTIKEDVDVIDDQRTDEEEELADLDYGDDESIFLEKGTLNKTSSDYEEPMLDEILSD